jgi:mannosyltransferase
LPQLTLAIREGFQAVHLPHGQNRLEKISGPVFLIFILIVAAVLRFHDLDRTSLWYDEAVSWSQSNGGFLDLLSSVSADNYPPLHNVLLWISMPIIGDSETAIRLPSAVLGVAAVWLTYLVGRTLGGTSAGLSAAALLAISPFHIWYSTEARMYALLAASGLAFLFCVLKVIKKPTRSWLISLSICGALFLYSHIYALLGFVAVGFTCALFTLLDLIKERRFRYSRPLAACLALAVSTLAFLPWLVILANRARSVAEAGFWIAYPDSQFLKNIAFTVSGSLVLFWLLAGLAVFGLFRGLLGSPSSSSGVSRTGRRSLLICLAYTVGPPILAYMYSIFVQPILFDRYLVAAWPGFFMLAAVGAQMLLPKLAPIALIGGALFLSFPELKFTLTQKIRPEWREVAREYEKSRATEDRLFLYKGFAAPALAYYIRDPQGFEPVPDLVELRKVSKQSASEGTHWLLIVHSNAEETEAALEAFSATNAEPEAQHFGWGASGLKLVQKTTARQNQN